MVVNVFIHFVKMDSDRRLPTVSLCEKSGCNRNSGDGGRDGAGQFVSEEKLLWPQ